MALEKRVAVPKVLPSRVFDSLMRSANLSDSFFLQETAKFPGSVDKAAERMKHDYQMNSRFIKELKAKNGFSDEVMDWKFQQFTGIKIIRPKFEKSRLNHSLEPLNIGVSVNILTDSSLKNNQSEIKFELSNSYPEFLDWPNPEGESPLQKMIAQAKTDPDANLFGGGLPPTELTAAFHRNVFIPAYVATLKWSDQEIDALIQNYPNAGAAPEHRNLVIDSFIGEEEHNIIRQNFTKEKQSDGLFFTYGSQQALSYMIRMLVLKTKDVTSENPVEIAITDPTYAGLLMASNEFMKQGLVKFRIIPIDEKTGQMNIKALRSALDSKRCEAIYLAEGNPIPKQITNLDEVAEELKKEEYLGKKVFEDRAYLGLGATEKNSLFHLLPNRVVAFETFSKKGAPGRIGLVYSNMEPGKFAFIKEAMLKPQYNEILGYSGNLSGEIVAILKYDEETHAFTEHIQKVQAFYEKQRALYEKSYREALYLAFENDKLNLDDEVIIGKEKFMFGWRNTHHVSADLYAKIGEKIKLYSLAGSTCRPESKYISGNQPSNPPTLHYLRQNYTRIKPENLQIGVYKDVFLEVVLSATMGEEAKQRAIERLYKKMKELNHEKILPEVETFIEKISQNHYQYSEELFQ